MKLPKNLSMTLLALWMILIGLGEFGVSIPYLGILALISGVLIFLGK